MPHYKDGVEAKLGDKIKGKPYNTPHEVVGEVIGITPGETCNLTVLFLKEEKSPEEAYGPKEFTFVKASNPIAKKGFYTIATDHGAIKDFEKVL